MIQGRSISALTRELVAKGLSGKQSGRLKRTSQFSFVGGRSMQGDLAPVSERHDEALRDVDLK
jgi:hypothetical protein